MSNKKPTFSRGGKTFGSSNTAGNAYDTSSMTPEEIQEMMRSGLTFKKDKNLFLADNLTEDENESLMQSHLSNLNERIFQKLKPQWNLSKRDAIALQLEKDNEINAAQVNTDKAYRIAGLDNIDISKHFSMEKHMKLLCLYSFSEYLMTKNQMEVLHDVDMSDIGKQLKLGDDNMAEALKKFMDEGKVISILQEAEGIYADVSKLADKYSVRLGDGQHFVASDDVKVVFRDPSDNPAWATWFLDAVPLANIPDRAKLVFLDEEDREQHMPDAIPDRPIICNAQLWKLGQTSGVLLTTSWNHISVTYRWKIDKPFEIASLLFKAVSHPAHIARNFGYAPQLIIPGDEWF